MRIRKLGDEMIRKWREEGMDLFNLRYPVILTISCDMIIMAMPVAELVEATDAHFFFQLYPTSTEKRQMPDVFS